MEGVEEQEELGLAVHGVGVVGGHPGVTSLQPSWWIYSNICVGFITLLDTPSPEISILSISNRVQLTNIFKITSI